MPEYDARMARAGAVHLRRGRPEDRTALRDLHAHLSTASVQRRYFTAAPNIERELDRLLRPVDDEHETLVALIDTQLVGVACYESIDGHRAEIAFLVDDEHHGLGLATLLLEILVAAARRSGISEFVADTLPGNLPMLSVFRDCGLNYTAHTGDGVVHLRIPLASEVSVETWPASIVDVLRPRLTAVEGNN